MILSRKFYTKNTYLSSLIPFGRYMIGLMNVFRHKRDIATLLREPGQIYLKGYRAGQPELIFQDDGQVKCISCGLCETACPAKAIEVIASEQSRAGISLSYGSPPKIFKLSVSDCFNCGHCMQVCPVDALGMDGNYTIQSLDEKIDLTSRKPEASILSSLIK